MRREREYRTWNSLSQASHSCSFTASPLVCKCRKQVTRGCGTSAERWGKEGGRGVKGGVGGREVRGMEGGLGVTGRGA